jgi:hypothetical protein
MKLIPPCLALLAIVLIGCSGGTEPIKVTQAEYGERWPFTVSEGIIDCVSRSDVVMKVGEDVYAVNGTARSKVRSRLYKDLAEIWRNQPAGLEGKVPIPDELMQQGLKVCDTRTGR